MLPCIPFTISASVGPGFFARSAAAASGLVEAEGFRVRLLALDEDTYRLAYDVVSNEVLFDAYGVRRIW
mgnify:CR=1 FL=1